MISPARTCPACTRRESGVVAADCPICRGVGLLWLSDAALSVHPPEVVALAVEYALEAAARRALSPGLATDALIAAGRRELTATVDRLINTRVLDERPHLRRSVLQTRVDWHAIHRRAVQLTLDYRRGDAARLRADPLRFELTDRPLATGGYPGFSAAGYLCFIARVADPVRPLAPGGTPAEVLRRRRTEGLAATLARATDPMF